jgi:hypothetical protein
MFTSSEVSKNEFENVGNLSSQIWQKKRSSLVGGGLLVYIRSDLACDRKIKLECKFIESMFVEINGT